ASPAGTRGSGPALGAPAQAAAGRAAEGLGGGRCRALPDLGPERTTVRRERPRRGGRCRAGAPSRRACAPRRRAITWEGKAPSAARGLRLGILRQRPAGRG